MKSPADKSGMTRVVTALIGVACILPIVIQGGAWFNALIALLAFAALRELVVAARRSAAPIMPEAAYPALAWVLVWLWQSTGLWSAQPGAAPGTVLTSDPATALLNLALVIAALFLVPVALLARAVWRFGKARPASLASVGLTHLAISYCGLFAFLMLLRAVPLHGPRLFWMLLLGVWAGDTLAYYGGKMVGKVRLTPLSPGKTREGALIGFAASFVVALAIASSGPWMLVDKVAFALLIALFAPLGDLAESLWKRELEVKDMGNSLPGHGGVLDRCDSLLFAVVPVFFYAILRLSY